MQRFLVIAVAIVAATGAVAKEKPKPVVIESPVQSVAAPRQAKSAAEAAELTLNPGDAVAE